MEIKEGMTVSVESTIGRGETAVRRIITGIVYRDEEGTLRIPAESFAPNLERDENGYFMNGIVVLSVSE